VERALDWLADLAGERSRAPLPIGAIGGKRTRSPLRLYTPVETARLSVECRGLLLSLEEAEILNPTQREVVIDRLLALEVEDLNVEHVRWVVLMVLSSQPGQEQACARMETLVYDTESSATH
jgi:Smg protein